jgi:hypothetical protein
LRETWEIVYGERPPLSSALPTKYPLTSRRGSMSPSSVHDYLCRNVLHESERIIRRACVKKWCFVLKLGQVRGHASIAREGSQLHHATSDLRSQLPEYHFNGSSGGESGSPKIGAETGDTCQELGVVTPL